MNDLQMMLRHFTGSERFYYMPLFPKFRYTEGVQYIHEHVSGWLITDIFAFQGAPAIQAYATADSFQFWVLRMRDDDSAILVCEDGNKNEIFKNEYDFVEFPLKEFKLYFIGNTLLLPSEY